MDVHRRTPPTDLAKLGTEDDDDNYFRRTMQAVDTSTPNGRRLTNTLFFVDARSSLCDTRKLSVRSIPMLKK